MMRGRGGGIAAVDVQALQDRAEQPAILSVRLFGRAAVPADHDRRHDLGRSVPARRSRTSITPRRSIARRWCRSAGSSAVRCWAIIADRIGRRKPVLIGGALLMLVATAVLSICRTIDAALRAGPAAGHRLRCRDDPLHDHQGGQPGQGEGQCDRRDQFPRLRPQRADRAGLWLAAEPTCPAAAS